MKKSFTLIELLLSIFIFSILFLAMSDIIKNLKLSSSFIQKKYQKDKNYLLKVLYNDLINSTSIKIIKSTPDYDRLILTTKNSLYKLINPKVIWYVSKDKNSLIRMEGYKKFPFNSEFIDKFNENVEILKFYKKNSKLFIYIKGKKSLFFEIII